MAVACSRAFAGLLSSALLLVGCGQSDETPKSTDQVCVPLTVYSCARGGCTGHQGCNQDGSALTKCVCDDNAPSAGSKADPVDDAGPDARDASAPDASSQHEICDNGKDDDADGQIDCADSDCTEVACVAAAPAGWHGPIALDVGATPRSDCRGSFDKKAFEAGAEPSAEAATCSACSCSGGETPCAAFIDFGTGSEAECAGTQCTTSLNQSCAQITTPCLTGLATAYLQTKLPGAAGACTPSPQTATKPEAQWKTHALGCAASATDSAGCKSGHVCLPKAPGADFADNYCIWQVGDVDCPNAQFPDKQRFFEELADTRACSACACSGPNCSYSWQVFATDDSTCAAPLLELSSAGQCVQVNPTADKLRLGAAISGDGKCTPSGGASQGDVTAKKPVTVCCAH
jgi:hypothetical protein